MLNLPSGRNYYIYIIRGILMLVMKNQSGKSYGRSIKGPSMI